MADSERNEDDDLARPRPAAAKGKASEPLARASEEEEADGGDDDLDEEEEAERARRRRRKKKAAARRRAEAARAERGGLDEEDEEAHTEAAEEEEDPYWWTPHAVLVALVVIGLIGFLTAYQKQPKPPADAPQGALPSRLMRGLPGWVMCRARCPTLPTDWAS